MFDSVSVERTWGNIKCIGSIYLLYSHYYHLGDDNCSSLRSVVVGFLRFRCELNFFRSYHKSPVLQRFVKFIVIEKIIDYRIQFELNFWRYPLHSFVFYSFALCFILTLCTCFFFLRLFRCRRRIYVNYKM